MATESRLAVSLISQHCDVDPSTSQFAQSVIPVPRARRLFTQREHNPKQFLSNLLQSQPGEWLECSPNEITRIVVCSRKCH